jgi:hypothetical protein
VGLGLAGVALLGCIGGQLGFQFADQRLELGLVEQAQLARGDAIGAGAEALAAQQLDVLQQLINALNMLLEGAGLLLKRTCLRAPLALGLGQFIAQLADDPVQDDGVIGQWLRGALHACNYTGFSKIIRVLSQLNQIEIGPLVGLDTARIEPVEQPAQFAYRELHRRRCAPLRPPETLSRQAAIPHSQKPLLCQ